jgi:hypothetical protein
MNGDWSGLTIGLLKEELENTVQPKIALRL